MKRIITTFVLCVFLTLPAMAQLTGKIKMISVPDRYKISNKGQSTTGLTAVGIGQRVVMKGIAFGGAGGTKYNDTLVAITSASWSITSKPAGSAVAMADTGGGSGIMYFIPDSVGTYVVSMTATTPLGAAIAGTITINAAKFVGAGLSAPATNGVANVCLPCHTGSKVFTDLLATNHGQAVKRKLNETGGHFGTSCMNCHAIGVDYITTTKNDGWDDLAAAADSTYKKWFPNLRPNGPGTFDSLVVNNPKLMARAGIQCENCHGAAGEHIKTGDKSKLDVTLSSNVCQPCHYSSDRHGIGYQWEASAHAKSQAEGASQVVYMSRFTCARCHTSQGYINEIIGGKPQPVAPITSGLVYENPMPVGCTTCHDPHTNNSSVKDPVTGAYTYPQLRAKKIEEVCIGCHSTRVSSRGLHSAHQGSMILGTGAVKFTLEKAEAYRTASTIMENNVGTWGGWELPGYTYENGAHSEAPELCVTCHMAKSPSYIAMEKANFAIADSLMTKLGRHTFNVATTLANGKKYLNPTGCVECHGTVTIEFVELTQEKTNTLLAQLYTLLPKRDTTINAANGYFSGTPSNATDLTTLAAYTTMPASKKRTLTTIERAACYNYAFVKNDLSGGVHNFTYSKGLLESSIEQLKLGAGASTITQVKDVPNDNGNQVQVVWNKFPAESFSYGRLTSYGVWRVDPEILPKLGKTVNPLTSYTQMFSVATEGGQYTMAGSVYTFIASVPVSGQSMYAYIAPTLYDSTKTGLVNSTFLIVGNTSDGSNTVYASPTATGYSINNLLPSIVAGVSGSSSSKGVNLTWKKSTLEQDNDIAQFAVYRSTTAGFTPDPASPYATVKAAEYLDAVVTTGTTYYYRIGAIDKAGNAGPYSNEFSLKVTSVEQLSGMPTTFAMDQNYPNPFNPSTQIKFALPSQSYVSLNIYNVSGELVRTLVNNDMSAGFYSVTWNGMNDHGQTVSTGVYLFRVQTGTFVSTKKMLLVK